MLAEVDKHPNRRYFILKSIIVNNLYGVDIMEEAVEICKLRLFLKLVAQVERVKDLSRCPTSTSTSAPATRWSASPHWTRSGVPPERDALARATDLGETDEDIRRIEEDAEIVERAFQKFHEMQTDHGMDAREFAAAKQELRSRLKKLADELDRYLAGEYGVDPSKTKVYDQWRESHQPFHWFAEFYGIMQRGGFDVVIGNPPYVVYAPSKVNYGIEPMKYQTLPTKNLYAYVFERSIDLVKRIHRLGLSCNSRRFRQGDCRLCKTC